MIINPIIICSFIFSGMSLLEGREHTIEDES